MRRARSSLYPWVPILRAQDTKNFRYRKVKAYQIEGRRKEKDGTKQLRAESIVSIIASRTMALERQQNKTYLPQAITQ